ARANFYPTNDVVGSGFNVSSYNNPRVNELLDAALVVPGCDQEARAEIYHQVYEILKEDVPWIWVNTNTIPTAAQPDLQNWDPQKGAIRWNIDAWYPAAR